MVNAAIAQADRYEGAVLDLAWHIHQGIDLGRFVSREAHEEAARYVDRHGVDAAIARIGG